MKTTAERQREWRRKRREEGYVMRTIWLDPDVAEKLENRLQSDTRQAERERLINEILRQHL